MQDGMTIGQLHMLAGLFEEARYQYYRIPVEVELKDFGKAFEYVENYLIKMGLIDEVEVQIYPVWRPRVRDRELG